MNTSALKKFAREARIKLLDQVGRKMDFVLAADNGRLRALGKPLEELKEQIEEHGKERVTERVAYTWFNRLMSLRFMDANGYNSPMVMTPLRGGHLPEILQEASAGIVSDHLQLDRSRLNDLLDGKTQVADAQREVYKMLLIASCNALYDVMPFMFERISDYTELLLPDDLLSEFSIVTDIRDGMSDEDCKQEELIGWLYQFYIADKKDQVFDGLKKNVKITAENIPAATQLFTPRWIVRYMVENTLGKLWLTYRPQSKLREHLPYYIEAPEGNDPAPLPEGINGVTDITFLDPCMGSGHILVYAFELFTKIYEEEGYSANEIPGLILQHNLYGMDIDERAAQLAAFALTMKARSYYPRFLKKVVHPHVIALEHISGESLRQGIKLPLSINGRIVFEHEELSLWQLTEADNYGSLIQIDKEEVESINAVTNVWDSEHDKLKLEIQYLSRQYHAVVTNPPYMGNKGLNDKLKSFLTGSFSAGKADLYSAFILRCHSLSAPHGFMGMVTMESWMFLSSYAKLRNFLLDNATIHSFCHFGWHVMRIAFGTCSFVAQRASVSNDFRGIYSYLEIADIDKKTEMPVVFPKTDNQRYNIVSQKSFAKIPGTPLSAYRIQEKRIFDIFQGATLDEHLISDGQNITANNEKYLRYHWEVTINKVGNASKWAFYAKGGDYRKWWGNLNHVIDWSPEARQFYKTNSSARIIPEYLWFRTGITWTLLSSNKTGFRVLPDFATFDKTGSSVFLKTETDLPGILAFLNSKVSDFLLSIFSETYAYQINEIKKLPFLIRNVDLTVVDRCVEVSKLDWDAHETSSSFTKNEILKFESKRAEDAFQLYKEHWIKLFHELQACEERINQWFIDLYGLQNELSAKIPIEEITILQEEIEVIEDTPRINPHKVVIQFISYAVGCLFGRYSLDKPGLILANEAETVSDFLRSVPSPVFTPVESNVIPVVEGEWFTDNIATMFKSFLKAAFGDEHFEDNIRFIEKNLGKDIRKYFLRDFYDHHIRRYKKRPIYWLFSSSKGSFKALIYMHRYRPDTVSTILNDYLRIYIGKLETEKQTLTLTKISESAPAREKTEAAKRIVELEQILKELREYEAKLFEIAAKKIEIDLDDGVKVNYLKFKDVLVPIKGLEKEED